MISAVIFDLFGTLFAKESLYNYIGEYLKQTIVCNVGAEEIEKEFFLAKQELASCYAGLPDTENFEILAGILIDKLNLNFTKEKLANKIWEYEFSKCKLYSKAKDLILQLKQLGCKVAILTTGLREIEKKRLVVLGLANVIDILVVSEDVSKNKPAREIFEFALKKLCVSASEAIMFGDNYGADVLGAKNVGMNATLVINEKQLYEQIGELIQIVKKQRMKNNIMPIETVKGFRDILPPDSLKRQRVKEIIEKNFKLFGFVPIETPTIEYEELVRGDNPNDSAVSDRFRLKDRGGRELALRFEFTFQLKRIFKENPNIKLPFRRYQVGYVFRDEPVERNRYREFIQCDADIVGDSSIKADAECLALADKICKDLKIKYTLKVNNRKLINSILESLAIKDRENVLRELDKLDKTGEAEVKKSLKKYANEKQITKLFGILKKDIKYFLKEKLSGADEVAELLKLCKLYKIKAEFSPFLMRGLAYYTGSVFEGYAPEIKGSLFAGGRYDNSVGRYVSRQIPAVGISFGRLLDYQEITPETTKCIVVSINQDRAAIKAANKLRENNISCFVMDKISKALEFANINTIPFVIFVGRQEVKAKKVKLRDMKTGKETLLLIKTIIKSIN